MIQFLARYLYTHVDVAHALFHFTDFSNQFISSLFGFNFKRKKKIVKIGYSNNRMEWYSSNVKTTHNERKNKYEILHKATKLISIVFCTA